MKNWKKDLGEMVFPILSFLLFAIAIGSFFMLMYHAGKMDNEMRELRQFKAKFENQSK